MKKYLKIFLILIIFIMMFMFSEKVFAYTVYEYIGMSEQTIRGLSEADINTAIGSLQNFLSGGHGLDDEMNKAQSAIKLFRNVLNEKANSIKQKDGTETISVESILSMSSKQLEGLDTDTLEQYAKKLNGEYNSMVISNEYRQSIKPQLDKITTILSSRVTSSTLSGATEMWQEYKPTGLSDYESITSKAGGILSAIRIIGIVVAIISLSVMGIKYMIGSVEEKAEYKKKLVPFVVGIVLLVGITTLATIVLEFTNSVFNN